MNQHLKSAEVIRDNTHTHRNAYTHFNEQTLTKAELPNQVHMQTGRA